MKCKHSMTEWEMAKSREESSEDRELVSTFPFWAILNYIILNFLNFFFWNGDRWTQVWLKAAFSKPHYSLFEYPQTKCHNAFYVLPRAHCARSVRVRKSRPISQFCHTLFSTDILSYLQVKITQSPNPKVHLPSFVLLLWNLALLFWGTDAEYSMPVSVRCVVMLIAYLWHSVLSIHFPLLSVLLFQKGLKYTPVSLASSLDSAT